MKSNKCQKGGHFKQYIIAAVAMHQLLAAEQQMEQKHASTPAASLASQQCPQAPNIK